VNELDDEYLFINHYLRSLVIFVHSGGDTFREQADNRPADPRDSSTNYPFLFGGKVTEDVVDDCSFPVHGRTLSYIRPTDAHPDAVEVPIAEVCDDGIDSFVPGGAPALSDAYLARGQVKVVMDNDKVGRTDFQLLYESADRFAAGVHESLWAGEYHFLTINFAGAGAGLSLFFIKADAVRSGKVPDTHKADIVAVAGITESGITETYNQFHIYIFNSILLIKYYVKIFYVFILSEEG
jgi:hypothetical protein